MRGARFLEETGHGGPCGRLDRCHHHRRDCRLTGRTVHEERHGADHEHCARHCRGGGCQRHLERLWDRSRGMDRLSHRWLHRRVLADLGRTRDTGTNSLVQVVAAAGVLMFAAAAAGAALLVLVHRLARRHADVVAEQLLALRRHLAPMVLPQLPG
jgi:hypothetical protein